MKFLQSFFLYIFFGYKSFCELLSLVLFKGIFPTFKITSRGIITFESHFNAIHFFVFSDLKWPNLLFRAIEIKQNASTIFKNMLYKLSFFSSGLHGCQIEHLVGCPTLSLWWEWRIRSCSSFPAKKDLVVLVWKIW